MRSLLAFILTLLGGALALWFGIAFLAARDDYVALIRGGFLLLGLAGIGWGLVWHRKESVGVGLGLLMMGLGSFYFEEARQHTQIGSLVWQVEGGFRRPIAGAITLAHVSGIALLVANALMLHRRLGAYHMLTGNIVLIAVAVSMAIFLGVQ